MAEGPKERSNYIIMVTRTMMKEIGKPIDERGIDYIRRNNRDIFTWVYKISPQQKGLIVSKGLAGNTVDDTTNPKRVTPMFSVGSGMMKVVEHNSGNDILNHLAWNVLCSTAIDIINDKHPKN